MLKSVAIAHYANIEDEYTGLAYEVFSFRKIDGRFGKIKVERAQANTLRHVREQLLNYNAVSVTDIELQKVMHDPPRHLMLYSFKTGWRNNFKAYVTPWSAIERGNNLRALVPPQQISEGVRTGSKPAGTLVDWKREVANRCAHSDLGMMMLAAGFAPLFLRMIGRQSFGLHVHSPAKMGKSTMLLATESVGGVGREEEMPNWGDTTGAFGELCRIHCDRLLAINEAALLNKKKAYEKIQPTIYQIAESRERDRHSKSVFATRGGGAAYRLIFISNGEHSISDYAYLANSTRDDGELARCLDIPATRKDRPTVIDRYPPQLPAHKRKSWARRQLGSIRRGCELNHGVVLPVVIKYVMTDPASAKDDIHKYMDEFIAEYDTSELSGALNHAMHNVSLVYAGGCIAIDAGVLPYKKEDLLRAIKRCFDDALGALARDPLENAKKILRKELFSSRVVECRYVPNEASQCAGYYDDTGVRTKYVIRVASMRKWFEADPVAHRKIVNWLEQRGFLLRRQSRTTDTHNRPADWAERVEEWPNRLKTKVRSIVFFDPFSK